MNEQAMKDVLSLIRENYPNFTKRHQILADFILNNPQESAFLSINELSKKTGISPATITRFAQALGVKGYPEFQHILFASTQTRKVPFQSLKTMLRDIDSEKQAEAPEDRVVSTVAENMSLLEALCQPQTLQAIYRAADLLRKAKKIYVIGNGSSYSISYMLGFMLSRMYSNVQLLERSADVIHISNFCDAQKEDCLIAVGYSRYTKATFDTLSFFHEKGCSIIAITDSVSSPLALMASEVLIAPRDSYFGPVSAIALCSCLIAALAQHDASQMLERMEMQDALAESYGLYL